MSNVYTTFPKEFSYEDYLKLEQLELKENYKFFFSIFFTSHSSDIKGLLKKNNLAFYIENLEEKELIVRTGNSEQCKHLKYTFILFDEFIKQISK